MTLTMRWVSVRSRFATCRRAGVGLLVLAVLALTPAAALAEAPAQAGWADLAPGLTAGLDPASANDCTAGDVACVLAVIAAMTEQTDALGAACDHNAVFSLGYLRTTEAYLASWQQPGFFDDPAWMNHYDVVFAAYYFDARAAWVEGDLADVPPAWRTAFAAADQRRVSALGNFLLGMNAHINRDLPMVLADVGLTDATGVTHKPDHDRVNIFLDAIAGDVVAEIAARLDPTIDDLDLPGDLEGLLIQQVIALWREAAWRNAELLTRSPRFLQPVIRAAIEVGAGQLATVIVAATAYPPGQSSAARDAWCAANWSPGDPPPATDAPLPVVVAPDLDDPAPVGALRSALPAAGLDVDVRLDTGVVISR